MSIEQLNLKHNTNYPTSEISPFNICFKMTNNVRLRNVQFKMLHKIYPTLKTLTTWKIRNDPNCTKCQLPETLEHAIWSCTEAITTFNNYKTIHYELFNEQLVLIKEDITFGKRNMHAINCIITLIKQKLILQREEKIALNINEIKNIIRAELKLEKFIATKHNKLEKFRKKWGSYELLISQRG
jgi:hypothetical protein